MYPDRQARPRPMLRATDRSAPCVPSRRSAWTDPTEPAPVPVGDFTPDAPDPAPTHATKARATDGLAVDPNPSALPSRSSRSSRRSRPRASATTSTSATCAMSVAELRAVSRDYLELDSGAGERKAKRLVDRNCFRPRPSERPRLRDRHPRHRRRRLRVHAPPRPAAQPGSACTSAPARCAASACASATASPVPCAPRVRRRSTGHARVDAVDGVDTESFAAGRVR